MAGNWAGLKNSSVIPLEWAPSQVRGKSFRPGTIDLVGEEVIRELAERNGVSTRAITFRLTFLGYVQQ